LDDAQYQQLLEAIYDAAIDPGLWPNAIEQVSDALGAIGGMFISFDPHEPQRSAFALSRLDPDLMQDYLERHSQTCLWAQLPNIMPVGTASSGDRFVPASDLEHTEFYDDILRPQRILHTAVAVLARDAKRSVGFSMFRGRDKGPVDDNDVAVLSALAPHVKRAAQIGWRLAARAAVEGAKDAALDRLDDGVILIDRRSRVLFANRAASSIVALRDGLTLSGEGLRTAMVADNRRLQRLIADAASGSGGGTMRVSRPSLAESFLLLVSPTRPQGPWPVELGPVVVIFITDPERAPKLELPQLVGLFGLTATEAKVALLIASGKGGPECARELRMSANTVHTHMRRIFRKLGVHRQADLVRVLMRAGFASSGGDKQK
jgi:DNA-binding CsgD family transcriptional regulator/PAS domain-containing protein